MLHEEELTVEVKPVTTVYDSEWNESLIVEEVLERAGDLVSLTAPESP